MNGVEQLPVYRSCQSVVDEQFRTDETRSVVEALIDALAAAEGVPPTDIPPLFDVIDLDAIAHLFDHDGATSAAAILGFTYENWNVFIHADGRICVCDGTTSTDPELVFARIPPASEPVG